MSDRAFVFEHLDMMLGKMPTGTLTIISGTATGADKMGESWARKRGHMLLRMPASWRKDGKVDRSAGMKRNYRMAQRADALIAFWDGGSPGTSNMIELMEKADKPVSVVRF
jgi:hypothetical protein